MSSGPPPLNLSPPLSFEIIVSAILVIGGSTVEMVPEAYINIITNPLVFIVGMLLSAGLAAYRHIILAFAVAFFLVNLLRIMPKKITKKAVKVSPGVTEAFQPAGALEWVTNNKKWFVEKVLKEQPIAIQEKDVSTYPIQA